MNAIEPHSLFNIALFGDLPRQDVTEISNLCRWSQFSSHEQIIDRQNESSDIYFIVGGTVRIVNYSLSGREVTLDDLKEGAYFGELSAIDNQPRSASVMALTDCLIATMKQDNFLNILSTYPSLALKVMKGLAGIVRTSTNRIMDLSTLAANNRVQAELLRLARYNEGDSENVIIKPIPVHGDIASRVSTTRETVARVLNDLARQGIVERRKDELVISNLELLSEMVELVKGE